MKKLIRRASVLLSVIVLMVCAVSAHAASVPEFRANSTSVSVGKTTVIRLVDGAQNVRWSVSNKRIKIVSKSDTSIKIKGVSKGNATVTASSGNTSAKCSITVTNRQNAAQKISRTVYLGNEDAVAVLKNSNSYAVEISATLNYYNASGKLLGTDRSSSYCVGAGKTTALKFYSPNSVKKKTTSTKLQLKVSKSFYKDVSGRLKPYAKRDTNNLDLSVKNSGPAIDTCSYVGLFFDARGKYYGATDAYVTVPKRGTGSSRLWYPYSSRGYVAPTSYKIYCHHAYNYK